MSGGAAKRAKRGEMTVRQEALLNAMLGEDENAMNIAMYGDEKDFHKIPNIMKMVDDAKSVVAPPLAQVGEKRSLEPDNVNFDYDIEKKKLEIREKNLALYKQEQQAKLDFDIQQAKLETKRKMDDAHVYNEKKKSDQLRPLW